MTTFSSAGCDSVNVSRLPAGMRRAARAERVPSGRNVIGARRSAWTSGIAAGGVVVGVVPGCRFAVGDALLMVGVAGAGTMMVTSVEAVSPLLSVAVEVAFAVVLVTALGKALRSTLRASSLLSS